MIIGSCPYDDCTAPLWLPLAAGPLPRMERHVCEGCGRAIWTRHTRLDPQSWTDAAFRAAYDVDDVTKQVRELTAR